MSYICRSFVPVRGILKLTDQEESIISRSEIVSMDVKSIGEYFELKVKSITLEPTVNNTWPEKLNLIEVSSNYVESFDFDGRAKKLQREVLCVLDHDPGIKEPFRKTYYVDGEFCTLTTTHGDLKIYFKSLPPKRPMPFPHEPAAINLEYSATVLLYVRRRTKYTG